MYVIRIKRRCMPFHGEQATYYAGLNSFRQIMAFPVVTRYTMRFQDRQTAHATRRYLLETVRAYGINIGQLYTLHVINEKRAPKT